MANEVVMLSVHHPIDWESQESTEKTEIIQKILDSTLGVLVEQWTGDQCPISSALTSVGLFFLES